MYIFLIIVFVILFSLLSILLSILLYTISDNFFCINLGVKLKFDEDDIESQLKYLERKYPKIYKKYMKNDKDSDSIIRNICFDIEDKRFTLLVGAIAFIIFISIISFLFIVIQTSKGTNYEDFRIKYDTYVSFLENEEIDKDVFSLVEDISNINVEIVEKQRDLDRIFGEFFVDERFKDLKLLTFE